jgi:hypothetical protein
MSRGKHTYPCWVSEVVYSYITNSLGRGILCIVSTTMIVASLMGTSRPTHEKWIWFDMLLIKWEDELILPTSMQNTIVSRGTCVMGSDTIWAPSGDNWMVVDGISTSQHLDNITGSGWGHGVGLCIKLHILLIRCTLYTFVYMKRNNL